MDRPAERPLWLLWRPRAPRWFPGYGPTAADPTASTPIADHTAFELILALYLGLAWALMITMAPVVYLTRKANGRLRRLPAG